MKRAISLVATIATLTTATASMAAEHTILILEDAYFPQVTYLAQGDTVHFLNVSGGEHNIISKNGDWEIGPISNDAQVSVTLAPGFQKTFYNKASEGENGEYLVEGRMSFAAPPVN